MNAKAFFQTAPFARNNDLDHSESQTPRGVGLASLRRTVDEERLAGAGEQVDSKALLNSIWLGGINSYYGIAPVAVSTP